MPDIRLKNLVRDMIKPLKNKGIYTRNIPYLKLVFQSKKRCVVMPTFPASGANWTGDILTYVITKSYYGDFKLNLDQTRETYKAAVSLNYETIMPADARALNKPSMKHNFSEYNIDYIFHTHDIWKGSGLWFLDDAKTAMITRHIPTSLFSYYSKRRDTYSCFEDCLKQTGILERAIKFYNSWNRYSLKHPNLFYSFKYEDCREEPVKHFREAFKFMLNKNFSEDIILEALDYFSFEKQKERETQFNKDSNKHFHYKGNTSYKEETSPETYLEILEYLQTNLDYDFGYNYKNETKEIKGI